LKEMLVEENEHLSLDYLSQKLGVHPVHISRAVPKYLNCSLGEYMRQEKLRKAIGLFYNSKYSLTEISNICGFSDQSHFTRTFRMYFSLNPLEFRKKVMSIDYFGC